MNETHAIYYQAFSARDVRFDGQFFIGVTTTGIYCRPICPAKTPNAANCQFFDNAMSAEQAGFRPCLRCRPEIAPLMQMAHKQPVSDWLNHQFDEHLIEGQASIGAAAKHFKLSERHIRRLIMAETGVSPIAFIQTRRLLLAKQLLTETSLPITDIAFASGFNSVRRFNELLRKRYHLTPSQLRRSAANKKNCPENDCELIQAGEQTLQVQLSYRPPYDWPAMLDYISTRALKGAEWVNGNGYYRTAQIAHCTGWFSVQPSTKKHCLTITLSYGLVPVLSAVMARIRNLFDLSAQPHIIFSHLAKDVNLREFLTPPNNTSAAHNLDACWGIRVPGAFDGFELAVRAILGQQISVKAATTLARRYVHALGEEILTPFPELTHLSPNAQKVASLAVDDLSCLGILSGRAASIIALAHAYVNGDVQLQAASYNIHNLQQLLALPGLGPWTAEYIAMRAMRWPDAFPKEDMVLRRQMGGLTARQAEQISQAWRPWRSYAVLALWRAAAHKTALQT